MEIMVHRKSLFFNNSSKEIVMLQPLRWRCVECVIHHERDVRKAQNCINGVRTSNNRVTSSGDHYCCLLPSSKALRTCHSGFSDRNSTISTGIPNLGVWYEKWCNWTSGVGQKNPTPIPSVVKNPTPIPPKNLRLLATPTPQSFLLEYVYAGFWECTLIVKVHFWLLFWVSTKCKATFAVASF